MASTYSTNLKIELMGTGENSGTWGTITNTNLGTAFEQAVIGLGNPDYTSDANLTITLTNSNAAQAARALVLNVTSAFGSLTATRELIVPTIQKQYIVQNNTTGGQSITVKTSGGTGITVPNGRKAHLYVDGTNVIQMFDFVDINGGTIDGATVGAASASTGAFTSLTASGATTLNGAVALGDAAGDLITVPGTVNSNLLFTDATYDIGASGATRPRDLFLSRNLTVGGTLTLAGGVNLNGNVTVGDSSTDTLTINSTITSNLIFTDNTYDIGASGATRPRSLFLAGNITAAGNQTLTGALTVDSTTDSSSTTTGSIQTDGGVGIAKALFVGTTANIAGTVGIGDFAAQTAAGLNVRFIGNLASTDISGVSSSISAPATASGSTINFYSSLRTTATSGSRGFLYNFYAEGPSIGSTSTASTIYGFFAKNQGNAAINNAYGVYIEAQSGSPSVNLGLYNGGTSRLDGNVGVGVALSDWNTGFKALQIGAEGALWSSTSTAATWLTRNVFLNTSSSFRYIASDYANALQIDNDGAFKFYTAASGTAGNAISLTQVMTLANGGFLGIGPTSPAYKLDVRSAEQVGIYYKTSGAYGVIASDNTGTTGGGAFGAYINGVSRAVFGTSGWIKGDTSIDAAVYADSGGGIQFFTNNSATAKAVITSAGDFGINTSSPGQKLDVNGSIRSRDGAFIASIGTATKGLFCTYNQIFGSGTDYTPAIFAETGLGVTFAVNGFSTKVMSLDSSGNLLVGTTSGTQRLVVSKNDSGAYVGYFENTTGSNANGVLISTPNRAGSNGLYGLTVANSGGNAFAIYTDGTYGTISDINRKKNVETARNGYLTDLCALRVVKYNWKEQEDSEPKNIGFIAQEVEQVFPSMVQTDSNGQKMLTQPILIPMLVKAIQELKTEFDAYKASHP